ncbi:MAG TPA: hypothetical protein VE567_08680 [Sphingomonas sp.]|nr:hypothetical protein [Sphingomonas sp.]
MRHLGQASANDPANLYGFTFAADDYETILPSPLDAAALEQAAGPEKAAVPGPDAEAEETIDYGRLQKAIQRNREWYR